MLLSLLLSLLLLLLTRMILGHLSPDRFHDLALLCVTGERLVGGVWAQNKFPKLLLPAGFWLDQLDTLRGDWRAERRDSPEHVSMYARVHTCLDLPPHPRLSQGLLPHPQPLLESLSEFKFLYSNPEPWTPITVSVLWPSSLRMVRASGHGSSPSWLTL